MLVIVVCVSVLAFVYSQTEEQTHGEQTQETEREVCLVASVFVFAVFAVRVCCLLCFACVCCACCVGCVCCGLR